MGQPNSSQKKKKLKIQTGKSFFEECFMQDCYIQIEVKEFVDCNDKSKFNYAIESLTQKGFPFLENQT